MKNLKEYIHEAKEKKIAIGHFNISNLEALHAIAQAARNLNVPVIIGVSEGERDFVGVREAAVLVKSIKDQYNQPIFLNATESNSVMVAMASYLFNIPHSYFFNRLANNFKYIFFRGLLVSSANRSQIMNSTFCERNTIFVFECFRITST